MALGLGFSVRHLVPLCRGRVAEAVEEGRRSMETAMTLWVIESRLPMPGFDSPWAPVYSWPEVRPRPDRWKTVDGHRFDQQAECSSTLSETELPL